MIKKLRNKFILICMLLVTAVLVTVFLLMLVSNYNLFKKDSHDEMARAIDEISHDLKSDSEVNHSKDEEIRPSQKPASSTKPKSSPKPSPLPDFKKPSSDKRSTVDVVTIVADSASNSVTYVDFDFEIDEVTLNKAFSIASASKSESGVIYNLSLRYMKRSSSVGNIYAFADMTNEIAVLRQQALVMIFTGIGGLLAFFLITLLLSNLAMRPTIESYTQQKQFVADASHELRTPLTVILANTSILAKNAKTDDEKKWIDSTYSEGLRMKQLIDDMLFLAKSDADELPFEKDTFNFSDTVWSNVLPFESILLEKNATLITDDISADIFVFADETQLKHLITILLDNACKYVDDSGTVTVSLKTDADTKAIFKVKNTGTIISEEDLPHIFKRFYRADKVRSYLGGHGLGLSIAEKIVKRHKGKITVTSEESTGTEFTVILPLSKTKKHS